MNRIAPLLTPDTLLLGQSFSSKKKLFEHAAGVLASAHGLKASEIFASLFERERLGSTALGHGVAIPHGRIPGLADACGTYYRLDTGLDFDAPDALPVVHCFVLLVPREATESHLRTLGELAQFFADPAQRQALSDAPDAPAMLRCFTVWQAA